ncbi:hypothetical protein BS47DRAFT_64846 [Hydnum rufescens UP504]|uniref:Protein S-acyltransferase n=1 Tax=Hydnum rufescens UP504 TaxID=1448309 RepID=A0A9P6DTF3_9AGAM|nr:hypothetical protein BS47DRAFT_64846 [Hydnum rufescens UP504]
MAYLVICCGFYIVLGWDMFWVASRFTNEWKSLTPPVVYIIEYVLAFALGLSVGVMLAWQLHLISGGETSVESHDNARYVKVASQRGTEFVNSFDLGWKKTWCCFLISVGQDSEYSSWTLFLPVRCSPYTDGWSWARRPGMSRHSGINDEDELTDED